MAEKMREKLFTEFPQNTMQEWIDKVTVDLKGADFNKKLVWRTNEGFNVQPMYRLDDLKDLKNLKGFPGEYPFVRGNHKDSNDWYVRQNILVDDYGKANKKALDVLNRGVNSLGFVLKGCAEITKSDMETLLKDICLECVEINFVCECKKCNVIDQFNAVVAERGIELSKIHGGINIDPLGEYTLKGSLCHKDEPLKPVVKNFSKLVGLTNFSSVEVNGALFNNCGSSIVQELGFSLAAGADYLDALTNAGFSIDAAAPKIRFHFGIGSKYFMEIAKFRAARLLWSLIVKAYNPKSDEACKMHIFAETSEWNKSVYDHNVNMLRTQTEAMSAALGGIDSMLVHPFDDTYEATSSDLAERVARNQQLLLKEESHFEKVVDIAGGSYYIEELTENFANAAWNLFIQVQEEGGYIAALKKGFIQSAVKATAQARDLAIAQRKENFVGVNQFPNFNEKIETPICSCVFESKDLTSENADIETLKPYRGTQAFEKLRYRTDLYSVKNGRPLVYMFPMGNLAMRKARAQFACNFFACAGFQVQDNNGFKTVDEGVEAVLKNKAAIVVVCGADDEYAGFAPEVYAKLKDKAVIVVAGNPESRPELEAAGLVNYIHVKNNVLTELESYQKKLGIF